jgi:peptidoglycan hydrolase CwlO-like protein
LELDRDGRYLQGMARIIVTALVVLIIAGVAGYFWAAHEQTQIANQQAQMTALGDQLNKMTEENTQLRSEIAKVQDEETHLAAQNNALNEAIAKARLTGKIPDKIDLPYPPK